MVDSGTRLAVLIDADNARPSMVQALLAEVATYGTAHVKRAYGDWTGTNLKGWKEHLLAHSIQPMQQFAYTTGKNATDAAMVIDAMDLLYTERFDGFCLVSSDSDFTRLASRIRESGLTVYGFGEKKTPRPFVAACDKFIYLDNLSSPQEDSGQAAPAPADEATREQLLKSDTTLISRLRSAIDAASDDDGWAPLGGVGNYLLKQSPDFDSRSYGYAKLSQLIAGIDLFDLERRSPGPGKNDSLFVRDRRQQQLRRSGN